MTDAVKDSASARSSWAHTLSVPLMLGGGGLIAIQSQLNSQLAAGLGEGLRAGLLAAVISFGSGLLILSGLGLATARGRVAIGGVTAAVRAGRLRWYEALGGLVGAFFVAAQGVTVGTIGVALFIVAFTAGQACSSLLVDRFGLSPGGRHAVSAARLIAAGFALVAVILKAGEQLGSQAGTLLIPFALIAFVAGVGQSVQQALNGRVSVVAGSFGTTWNNFAVGTTALVALLAVSFTVDGTIEALPHEPWLYLGGLFGIGFIYVATWTVRIHGVLVLGLCGIAGQVVTAELIELVVDPDRVGILGLVGGGLTIVGVATALLVRPTRS